MLRILPNKLSFKSKKSEVKCSFHSGVILIYVVCLISLSRPVIIVGFVANKCPHDPTSIFKYFSTVAVGFYLRSRLTEY